MAVVKQNENGKNPWHWQKIMAKPRQKFEQTIVINRLSTENSG